MDQSAHLTVLRNSLVISCLEPTHLHILWTRAAVVQKPSRPRAHNKWRMMGSCCLLYIGIVRQRSQGVKGAGELARQRICCLNKFSAHHSHALASQSGDSRHGMNLAL